MTKLTAPKMLMSCLGTVLFYMLSPLVYASEKGGLAFDVTFVKSSDYAYVEFAAPDGRTHQYVYPPELADKLVFFDVEADTDAVIAFSEDRGLRVEINEQQIPLFLSESDSHLFASEYRRCVSEVGGKARLERDCALHRNEHLTRYIDWVERWTANNVIAAEAINVRVKGLKDSLAELDQLYLESARKQRGSKYGDYVLFNSYASLELVAISQTQVVMAGAGWTMWPLHY